MINEEDVCLLLLLLLWSCNVPRSDIKCALVLQEANEVEDEDVIAERARVFSRRHDPKRGIDIRGLVKVRDSPG